MAIAGITLVNLESGKVEKCPTPPKPNKKKRLTIEMLQIKGDSFNT